MLLTTKACLKDQGHLKAMVKVKNAIVECQGHFKVEVK